MTTVYCPAIIERGTHGHSVFFPDLPGCASGGDTIDEAARNTVEALRGHLTTPSRSFSRPYKDFSHVILAFPLPPCSSLIVRLKTLL